MRERHDDFAWENDRVAFRIYGQALETFEKEPLTSSTVDAWSKRTRRLVLNDWYLVDDYHRDHGEGGDFYSAGRTPRLRRQRPGGRRALAVSKNFRSSRVLARGPIRLVFELDYPEWERPGLKATEVKRVTLDAGSHFNRFESFYTVEGEGPITWAAGIRQAKGVVPRVDRDRGIAAHLGAPGPATGTTAGSAAASWWTRPPWSTRRRRAATSSSWRGRRRASPRTWYAGSGWDRSGDFPDRPPGTVTSRPSPRGCARR